MSNPNRNHTDELNREEESQVKPKNPSQEDHPWPEFESESLISITPSDSTESSEGNWHTTPLEYIEFPWGEWWDFPPPVPAPPPRPLRPPPPPPMSAEEFHEKFDRTGENYWQACEHIGFWPVRRNDQP
jgi:hypothetical protein